MTSAYKNGILCQLIKTNPGVSFGVCGFPIDPNGHFEEQTAKWFSGDELVIILKNNQTKDKLLDYGDLYYLCYIISSKEFYWFHVYDLKEVKDNNNGNKN